MSPSSPRISIGIPVYNGEKFLEACLESLLQQTFTDFEVIISDNASTDATGQICQDYVQRDRRVHYYRNEANLGPIENYRRVAELARGEYFKWQNYDDLCAPEFLAECLAVLEQDPEVVLCYSKMAIIDSQGQILEHYDYRPQTDLKSTPQRFLNLLCVDHHRHAAHEFFGVIRRSALLKILPQGKYARSDSVMLVRAALFGRFYEVPDCLFFNREHENRSSRVTAITIRSSTYVSKWLGIGPLPPTEWFDPSKQGKITMPEWNLVKQYWNSIWLPPLQVGDRLGCCLMLAYWLIQHLPKLIRDVLMAGEIHIKRWLTPPRSSRRSAQEAN
ncbi:MAG: glycosyltransferase family 2 protein [Synechococcales bacterium]|nr:glycosyltransferase family 2 protein [Synechococcales bacterium]